MTNCVFLETAKRTSKDHHTFFFTNPVSIINATELAEVEPALRQADAAVARGRYVAGFISYDAGFAFEKKLHHLKRNANVPLVWFGVYDEPATTDVLTNDGGSYSIRNIEFGAEKKSYAQRIEQIKSYIESGDAYQINFTGKLKFHFNGSAMAAYHALREKQPVPYAAYIDIGDTQLLSFSPELFFRVENGAIECKPMKGTATRGRTVQEDLGIATWLEHDEKNRAENLMILDLIRNDIGRICKTGSVKVPTLFDIEKHPTLFQMTSTVQGELKPSVSFTEIFKAIFPCGSITGAPKIRAMEIIAELEQESRGIYCGAIGFISPKKDACFSVAIRTLVLNKNDGEMGVGSGITWDSESEGEYDECRVKSKFLTDAREPFLLIESLKYHNGYHFFEQHLSRLKSSATYFEFDFDDAALRNALEKNAKSLDERHCYKVRLTLGKNGAVDFQNSIVEISEVNQTDSRKEMVVAFSTMRTDSRDAFFYHKTTRRKLYDDATAFAKSHGLADIIFLNERGEVAEGAISNIFIEKDGNLFTPPISAGILAGVYRDHVLQTRSNAREKTLYETDVYEAEGVFICNTVRGWQKVVIRRP